MSNNQEVYIPLLIEDLGMLYPTISSKKKYRYGLYKCNCGKTFKTQTSSVARGKTKSCGCYKDRLQSEIAEGAKFQRWYYDERKRIEPAIEDKSLLDPKNINLAKAMKFIK